MNRRQRRADDRQRRADDRRAKAAEFALRQTYCDDCIPVRIEAIADPFGSIAVAAWHDPSCPWWAANGDKHADAVLVRWYQP